MSLLNIENVMVSINEPSRSAYALRSINAMITFAVELSQEIIVIVASIRIFAYSPLFFKEGTDWRRRMPETVRGDTRVVR